jgi:glycosyltransferase involved in cell wall biosynthesis
MRVVFVTQKVDPADPILAATVPKIAALAARLDEVVVLADSEVPGVLPGNCRVRTFASSTKAGRGARFATALWDELRWHPRPTAVVAHMCPIYAVLAAPLARPLGVRVVLWFTHWNRSPTLRVAEKVSNALVSVDRRSFPIDSPKVVPIGHGIDLAEFPCRAEAPSANGTMRALALGRYSPSKGLDTVLRGVRAAADQGLDVQLDVYGPAPTEVEQTHRRELERLVADLELGERVHLADPVRRSELPRLFSEADVLVNNMRAGAPDKVVYEACASCLPVLASNPVFDELLPDELRFARESPEELAERLERLAHTDAAERARIGSELRERVVAGHSVESWAERVIEVAQG